MAANEISLSDLAEKIGGVLSGDGGVVVRAAASLEEAGPADVSFLANPRYAAQMAETKAAAVIVGKDYDGPGPALIRCEDPYFAYREAMILLHGFRLAPFEGIDARANIDPAATLAGDVAVGAFVTICRGATIGKGTVLYPGVFVGPDARVGEDCVLFPNVTLYDHTVLGDRVTVHAGSSIGQDGFGYATHKGADGVVRHEKIPPAGYVVLEDDVEIGACCAIERAAMGPTVIGAGTKFADLVAIGHGTKMGRHCLMVSQSGIAGSTMVGNYCVFGGQAGVVGHIRIGDGVRVGAQAGVTGDVAPGVELLGSPAIPRVEAGKSYTLISRLPELRSTVKKLLRQVEALQKRLDDLEGGEAGGA
ncbi:MAG: UDP-3-O-(3-hydroxymyristoyl)glucosamine N-acyltransferase [Phycisphaerae bacterium]|nr:UDP-3-O-(3-hydroxymyristoyl)glucosamine N-acyltransferase [Phycisphaerae bacterium]